MTSISKTPFLLPCPFESEFLGIPTFRLEIPASTQNYAPETEALLLQELTIALDEIALIGPHLVTCRRSETDRAVLSTLQVAGFRVIECLITLGCALDRTGGQPPVRVRKSTMADADAAERIGATAFYLDRFHSDPLVSDAAASRLKGAWARNSVAGRADAVFVIEEDGCVVGFNACLLRGDTAVIDLIAVAPGFQGRGLGRDLVAASLAYYAGKAARMIVGTQSTNYSSFGLYQSAGFRIEGSALTLHAHLN